MEYKTSKYLKYAIGRFLKDGYYAELRARIVKTLTIIDAELGVQ